LIINEIIEIFKIKKETLWEINTIGDIIYRKRYKILLKKFLIKNAIFISKKNFYKIKKNIIRILDTKNTTDIIVFEHVPVIFNFLSVGEKNNFFKLKKILDILTLKYIHNLNLVRGLNYYYNFVFEITTNNKNLKNTVIAGGGYLISNYEKIYKIKCIGFAIGLERLINLAYNTKTKIKNKKYICYVIDRKKIKRNIKFLKRIINKIKIYFTIVYIKKNILIFRDLIKMGINFIMLYDKKNFLVLRNIKSGIEKRIKRNIAIRYVSFLYKNY
jgi:histidyl-tRNA synthetase